MFLIFHFIHLLAKNFILIPLKLWKPAQEKVEPRAGFEFALHGVDIHEVPRPPAYEADAITPKPPRLN
jgi:hypothetical protein